MFVGACFTPHPPVIVPCVGRGREQEAGATVAAMKQLASMVMAMQPETLLVLSPHATMSSDFLPLHVAGQYRGNFRRFGVPQPSWVFDADTELITALAQKVEGVAKISKAELDHGALVPLAYLAEAGFQGKLALLGWPLLPATGIESFGQRVGKLLSTHSRRVVAVMSGDMSHALTPDAPNGFSPYGKKFDEAFVAAMQPWNTAALMSFDPQLAERGAQDALGSAQFLVGMLRDVLQVQPQLLSYEGPFGVGYLVQAFSWPSAA